VPQDDVEREEGRVGEGEGELLTREPDAGEHVDAPAPASSNASALRRVRTPTAARQIGPMNSMAATVLNGNLSIAT